MNINFNSTLCSMHLTKQNPHKFIIYKYLKDVETVLYYGTCTFLSDVQFKVPKQRAISFKTKIDIVERL